MLIGIDPVLTGSMLKALDDMGHSDGVLIVDANFPAHRTNVRVFEAPGVDIVRMTHAVASVLSLDEDHPPVLMESNLSPRPSVQDEIVAATGVVEHEMVDRWAYYDLAREAYCVIATGELRLWANVLLRKGLPFSQAS
ncbi:MULTISPECIES: RbsD/FucU family protein [Tessaracoccus]|uniref:RbsD/FucU family protein n=1 Tax=Tessaracoccus TaxID=72763 RepID=UPI00099DBD63|nr:MULTISPECIES: RbsD/FucU domain-containing protein [Tessaracoccus]AQX16478.1 hypothetical protein BKM78_11580 [Tessaracoccus sp. T2.5-30]VEP41131.1 L-fucose mutarotase [Tessaracoccus lapidicaptus]